LLACGFAGNRDDDFLGGFVSREQERQGDQEESEQSFHGGILFVCHKSRKKPPKTEKNLETILGIS
jgi:hypothetical protein